MPAEIGEATKCVCVECVCVRVRVNGQESTRINFLTLYLQNSKTEM